MAREDFDEENGFDNNADSGTDEDEGKKSNKVFSIIIGVLIAVIWLAVLIILIKLDVGGFGSSVLSPILEDVPVINMILPDTEDEEIAESDEYPYKSLAEAISKIKELEVEIEELESTNATDDETITELEAEVSRLQEFEDDQEAYEEIREQFYEEVVFGDDALDYDYYVQYYESIEPEIAEEIYQQVLEQEALDDQYQEFADTFSDMDPDSAASILIEMSGNLDTVVGILDAIDTEYRAEIMASLADQDSVYAAKVTQLLDPS